MGEVPLFGRLADWDESAEATDHWVTLFRRIRGLETELELLRASLAVWKLRDAAGSWPSSLPVSENFVDTRTGRPLVFEASRESHPLVARGDASVEAQEIRVQLAGAQ
jgi:hypothetical protein